jgi:glycine/D-amino acid oxidase-like deaminating enzyme
VSHAPGIATSYWMATTGATGGGTAQHAPLREEVRVDVAVIGAGMAGVCAAWEVARTGRSVALLEAGRVVSDVTGHTTAKLTALHGSIYEHIRSSFGAPAAALYARSQQDAIERVFAIAASLGIDCQLERRDAYTYTETARDVPKLQTEAVAAQQAGLPASFVTDTPLPYSVAGAVRVTNQAQFHPRRYLLGLIEDLVRQGGQVFEQTRVTRLHEGEPCRLETEAGPAVLATDVVIATHYPIFDRGLLFSRLVPKRELVVAAMISADRDPAGMYITDAEHTRSVRTAPLDGADAATQRLLIITGEAFKPGTAGVTERFERLASWTTERFGTAQFAYHWAAQDNTTTDRVPYVGRFHAGTEHVWVATGFGGWGMSTGAMAGALLAARIAGDTPQWTDLYEPRRIHPVVEASSFLKATVDVARHFVGDRLHAAPAEAIEDIAPGSGQVVRVDGERCAVYRDGSGALHAVSATCTHLGCIVAFNDAEHTWDCPCHGSRFDPDGAVIHGPATAPLEPREVPE